MLFATADMSEEDRKSVDIWSKKENESLQAIIYSLTLVSCSNSVTIWASSAQTLVKTVNVMGTDCHASYICGIG